MKKHRVFITYDAEHRVDYDAIWADSNEQAQEIALATWNDTNRNPEAAKNLKATVLE